MSLTEVLPQNGHDAIHTSDMRDGNRSSDRAVVATADREDRVVVSKDRDFRDGHLLGSGPRRLLVVSTGNINNRDLIALMAAHLEAIVDLLADSDFLELTASQLITHGVIGLGPTFRGGSRRGSRLQR